MLRAQFSGNGRIELEDVPVPEPRDGELLVRVDASALCGSDRGILERGSTATPGHETAGTVVARGPNTTTPEGSTGAVFLVVYCDQCARCRARSRGACLTKQGMLGFTADGGFAEFEVVPERCFLPVDGRVSAEEAVMLLDMTGTPMHALLRAGALAHPPSIAAVVGAGPVGLACVMALQSVGVSRVIALDVVPYRLQFAAHLGAEAIAADTDSDARLAAIVADGVPLVLEASGSPRGQRLALDLVAPGGQLVVIGHSPAPLAVFTSRDLIERERAIVGSEYFDPSEFDDNQRLVLDRRHDPGRLVTHRFALSDLEDAYTTFWSGETGKVVVYPAGVPRVGQSAMKSAMTS